MLQCVTTCHIINIAPFFDFDNTSTYHLEPCNILSLFKAKLCLKISIPQTEIKMSRMSLQRKL